MKNDFSDQGLLAEGEGVIGSGGGGKGVDTCNADNRSGKRDQPGSDPVLYGGELAY